MLLCALFGQCGNARLNVDYPVNASENVGLDNRIAIFIYRSKDCKTFQNKFLNSKGIDGATVDHTIIEADLSTAPADRCLKDERTKSRTLPTSPLLVGSYYLGAIE